MSDPLVMISVPVLAGLEPSFRAQGLPTRLAWELTAAERRRVRAILHAGEFVLEPALLETFPGLGLIACVSVGYDGVDVPWCRAHRVQVTHARGLNADDVADHALGLMIGSWRSIVAGDRLVREGRWRHEDRLAARPSLTGRAVGVVGLGAIGEAVARRCEALRMRVAWWGPREKAAPWLRAESLLALARDSDVLVICSRAERANRGMVSRQVIEAVGPQGLVVNVARGSLVDEAALIAALKDGRLGRAALDVFAEEPTPAARWADVPNVVLTPHAAGGTADSIPRLVAQAIDNVRRFLADEPLASPIP